MPSPKHHRSAGREVCIVAALLFVACSPIRRECRGTETKPSVEVSIDALNDVKREIVAAQVILLHDDSVRRDLKLTEVQKVDIDRTAAEIDYPIWYVREAQDAETKVKCARAFDHLEQRLATSLTPTQSARFDGILLQTHGWPAIFAPRFVDALKLTAEQQSRIREHLAAAKADSTTAAVAKQIEAVLSGEQRTKLTTLIGPRFDGMRLRKRYCRAPALIGVDEWINSKPLDWKQLEGKVVVVHFWAFGCINCVRNLPHYQAWHEKFAGEGVLVVGLHTPETASERIAEAVRAKTAEYKMAYPVAIDGAAKNWNAWATRWWPSVYLVDKRGYIRYWWAGELNWQGTEGEAVMRKRIAELLAEKD